MRDRLSRLLGSEWPWLSAAAIAPFLMFPSWSPALVWAGGCLVMAAWSYHWARAGLAIRAPFGWPLVLLLSMVLVGDAVSPLPALSAPKLAGVALGGLAYLTVLQMAQTRSRLWLAVSAYVAAGCALVAIGLVTTAWIDKFAPLAAVTRRLPRLGAGLPGAETGAHPNALAGLVLFVLPLLVVLCVARPGYLGAVNGPHRGPSERALRGAVAALALFLGFALALTQSRGAWLGFLGAAGVLAATTSNAWRRAVGGSVILALIVVAWQPRWVAQQAVDLSNRLSASTGARVNVLDREEIWARALEGIGDFPMTGMGLDAFREAVHLLYPLMSATPTFDIAHAHNIFLQVALDTGLPGLIAYASLLILAVVLCGEVRRLGGRDERILASGLGGGLLAVHLFGLVDAVALGTKIGLMFWLNLGLIAALHRQVVGRLVERQLE